MDNLFKTLAEFGLSQNEYAVYVALLRKGPNKVATLAKTTDIIRTSLYEILDSLIEKGIVNYHLESGIKIYSAAEPSSLIRIMEERTDSLKEILPLLEKEQKPIEESYVEYYRGKRGILSIFSDILKTKSNFLVYGNYDLSRKVLKHFPLALRKKRLDLNLKSKIIIDPTTEDFFKESKYKQLTQIRFHKAMTELSVITFVYKDSVAMFTQKEDIVGVIIKNKEIANTHRIIFNNFWENAIEIC